MPSNIGPAFGAMASVLGSHFAEKKKQEHDDEQKRIELVSNLVSSGLQSGSIANPQEAFQFLLDQIGSKGGKGKGAKGQLPPALQMVLGATQQAAGQAQGGGQTLGGQSRPSFPTGAPTAPQGAQGNLPRFRTAEESQALAEGAYQRKAGFDTTEAVNKATQLSKATYDEQIRKASDLRAHNPSLSVKESLEAVGFKFPNQAMHFAPGSVAGGSLPPNSSDIYGNPIDPAKYYRQGADQSGQMTFVPTDAPTGQRVKAGTPEAFFKQKESELGHKLSSAEQVAARREWVDAGDTPDEKMARAKVMANFRYDLQTRLADRKLPDADTVQGEAQVIRMGGQDIPYLNLDGFTGEKSKNKARKDAQAAGIVPVTKQQADQLAAVNTSLGSLNAFMQAIKDKLPEDAKSRPLVSIENKLSQYFQTDDDLASAVSWNLTVLPQLRAMSVTGRVPVFEYQQALNAQPRLTDTVGAAAKKMAIVQGVLERGARSILDRGKGSIGDANAGTATNARREQARKILSENSKASDDAHVDTFLKNNPTFAAGAATAAVIPAAVQSVLKDVATGRHTLSDGSVWDKLPSGEIRKVQ